MAGKGSRRLWVRAARAWVLVGLVGAPVRAQEAPACEETATTADLARALGTAEAYFSSLNVEGFRAATDEAEAIVPCLHEAIPQHLAAELHRFMGLRAFVERAVDRSASSFAAARALEPQYRFPEFLIPPGNPVLASYAAVDPSEGTYEPIPLPREGTFRFDGRRTRDRPVNWPTLVQHFDDRGRVLRSAYLNPEDVMFAYQLPKPRIASVPMLIGAAVSCAASGALLAAAWQRRRAYDDVSVPHEDLPAMRATTNALSLGSAASGAAGLGLGVTAFLVVRGS